MNNEEQAVVVETVKKAGRDWLKNIASVISSTAIVGAALWWIFSPRIDPILNLPDQVTDLKTEITDIQLSLKEKTTPQFIKFLGNALVVDRKKNTVTFLYLLKREVSCNTDVHIRFYNVGNNRYYKFNVIPSTKAPVTSEYYPFSLDIKIPESLPPGRYSYHPRLIPQECGVYKEVIPPLSETFIVGDTDE